MNQNKVRKHLTVEKQQNCAHKRANKLGTNEYVKKWGRTTEGIKQQKQRAGKIMIARQ